MLRFSRLFDIKCPADDISQELAELRVQTHDKIEQIQQILLEGIDLIDLGHDISHKPLE